MERTFFWLFCALTPHRATENSEKEIRALSSSILYSFSGTVSSSRLQCMVRLVDTRESSVKWLSYKEPNELWARCLREIVIFYVLLMQLWFWTQCPSHKWISNRCSWNSIPTKECNSLCIMLSILFVFVLASSSKIPSTVHGPGNYFSIPPCLVYPTHQSDCRLWNVLFSSFVFFRFASRRANSFSASSESEAPRPNRREWSLSFAFHIGLSCLFIWIMIRFYHISFFYPSLLTILA